MGCFKAKKKRKKKRDHRNVMLRFEVQEKQQSFMKRLLPEKPHHLPPFLTCGGGLWLQRRGVRDAPQGHSARRVTLDQQLMEGLPPAEEEAGHRRADEELEEGRKKYMSTPTRCDASKLPGDSWKTSLKALQLARTLPPILEYAEFVS